MSAPDGYADWRQQVDNLFVSRLGVGIDDLEDFTWRDCFDCGNTPREALEAFVDYFPEYEPLLEGGE